MIDLFINNIGYSGSAVKQLRMFFLFRIHKNAETTKGMQDDRLSSHIPSFPIWAIPVCLPMPRTDLQISSGCRDPPSSPQSCQPLPDRSTSCEGFPSPRESPRDSPESSHDSPAGGAILPVPCPLPSYHHPPLLCSPRRGESPAAPRGSKVRLRCTFILVSRTHLCLLY